MKIKIGNIENEIQYLDKLFKKNNNAELIVRAQILIKKFPKIIPFYNLLGLTYKKMGKQNEAIKVFQLALFQDPNSISVLTNLSDLYREVSKISEAEELIKKAFSFDDKDLYTLISYGKLKVVQGKITDAIEYFKQANKQEENFDDCLARIGSCYITINEFDNAKKFFEKAIFSKNSNTGAHFSFSQLNDYSSDKKHQDYMLKSIDDKSLGKDKYGPVYFALAKSFSDQKDYRKESEYIKLANDEINKFVKKDKIFIKEKRELDAIKSIFKDINFENLKINKKIFEKNIIFIIGLPRSGTSLAHQIIASHSKVKGAGETNVLHSYFSPNIKNQTLQKKFLIKENLNEDLLSQISLNLSRNYTNFSNQKVIVDKSPFNFWWLGFIKLIFPNSKIIHTERNIKDTAFSIYKNMFGTRKMDWSYSQENIIRYIRFYRETMDFWKLKLPNFIYDLSYEKLVKNQEEETQKLLKFCDLDWEENCLNFHQSAEPLHTVSLYQVRHPIYQSSVNLNEKYTLFSDFFKKLEKI
tara:strand:- start:4924 stop:6498 length:1575 start_codon:yes stop_codon:yes gene_type:complete